MARQAQELWVFLHGEPIGVAVRSRRGAVHFSYVHDRPESDTPLSLSLQPGQGRTLDVSSWIDGLLPDNQRTRSRWAHGLGAASTDPFDLLSTQAGLECAGAVQFHPHPRLPEPRFESLVGLSEAGVASALRLIVEDAEDAPSEGLGELRLSLPGAQPKLALRLTEDGWHLPTGSLATTHILKPQRGHLNPSLRTSIAVNEHLCQTAASMLGLDAARTSLEVFDDEVCLVAERFDRYEDGGEVGRLHFEDMCQALGFAPDRKYQSDGGPTPEAVIGLLRHEAGRGAGRQFFLSLYYNWLIGNADGHSKNYGVILQAGRHRMAPLYDLSSAAIYPTMGAAASTPAMHFEGWQPKTLDQWSQLAAHQRIDVVDDLAKMAQELPAAFRTAAERCPDWASATAQQICEDIIDRARSRP